MAHRGRIGFLSPAGDTGGMWDYLKVLPEGVVLITANSGVSRLVSEDLQKALSMYPVTAKHLADQECDVILVAGEIIFAYLGHDRSREMLQVMREIIRIPMVVGFEAHFDALRALSAKKIVISAPYEESRTAERKLLCERAGFEVLNTKSLGLIRRVDVQEVSPYTVYRQAKQAFFEAPAEADAIYICCPEWPAIEIVEQLEQDTRKPVVTFVGADIRACLKAMHIKESVPGYGRLLKMV